MYIFRKLQSKINNPDTSQNLHLTLQIYIVFLTCKIFLKKKVFHILEIEIVFIAIR